MDTFENLIQKHAQIVSGALSLNVPYLLCMSIQQVTH